MFPVYPFKLAVEETANMTDENYEEIVRKELKVVWWKCFPDRA
jgi:hypothetical protein